MGGEWEPFANFKDSTFGIVIQLVIAVAHWLIVEVGGTIMQTTPLNTKQWTMCIGIGMCSLIWGGVVVTPIARIYEGGAERSAKAADAPALRKGAKKE